MDTKLAEVRSPRLIFGATGTVRRARSIWMCLRACFGREAAENQRFQINLFLVAKMSSQQFTPNLRVHDVRQACDGVLHFEIHGNPARD